MAEARCALAIISAKLLEAKRDERSTGGGAGCGIGAGVGVCWGGKEGMGYGNVAETGVVVDDAELAIKESTWFLTCWTCSGGNCPVRNIVCRSSKALNRGWTSGS